MRTVALGELPPPVEEWLARRRALGQDGFDEVWDGEYHVAPLAGPGHGDLDDQVAVLLGPLAKRAGLRGSGPLNIGHSTNYRVPDRAYLAGRATTTFVPTAVIVVETLSPNDEIWQKLDFYAAQGIEELIVLDPIAREVRCLARSGSTMTEVPASARLGISADELTAALDWPPLG